MISGIRLILDVRVRMQDPSVYMAFSFPTTSITAFLGPESKIRVRMFQYMCQARGSECTKRVGADSGARKLEKVRGSHPGLRCAFWLTTQVCGYT